MLPNIAAGSLTIPPLPVVTDSGGNVIAGQSIPIITDSNGNVIAAASSTLPPALFIPIASDANQPVVPNPAAATNTALAPFIPVVTEDNGNVVPNPAAATNTDLASVPLPPIVPIETKSDVNLVANPAAATNTALPPLVPAITDSNGVVLPNPAAATNTALAPIVPSSEALQPTITASNGAIQNTAVPLPTATDSGALPTGVVAPVSTDSNGVVIPASTAAVVGSSTLSNGDVVPITAGEVTGSSTLPNGNVVPITTGEVTGSSTLPNGNVVPVTASPASAAASGVTTLPNGSVVPVSNAPAQASTTLSDGQVVPVASAQASVQPGATETGQATQANAAGTAQPSTVVPAVQSFPTGAKGPFTQEPIGSDSLTAQSVPTNIIVQPSDSMSGAASTTGSEATGLPTGVPLVLYPPQGPVEQPENTDMIQIGFRYPLNYDFVWTHDESQQQIFKYLPLGISYGLNIEVGNVTMQTLRAWDTTHDLHYITTLALAWIPSGLVDTLGLLVQTQTSRFYNNPDNSTNTLLSMINNALPIAADNSTDGGNAPYGAMPTSSANAKDNGAPIGGSIGSSAPVRPSSAAIGVGVACGAAAYGAAIFFVAKRYKKRRQSHLRSPSMYNSPVMSHIGPDVGAGAALMSGGIDRSISPYHDEDGRAGSRGSGRSGSTGRQQISAPVMAENSLGWN